MYYRAYWAARVNKKGKHMGGKCTLRMTVATHGLLISSLWSLTCVVCLLVQGETPIKMLALCAQQKHIGTEVLWTVNNQDRDELRAFSNQTLNTPPPTMAGTGQKGKHAVSRLRHFLPNRIEWIMGRVFNDPMHLGLQQAGPLCPLIPWHFPVQPY
jgi:hypothetical protein